MTGSAVRGAGPVPAPARVGARRVGVRAVALSLVLVVLSGLAVAFLVAYARGGELYLAVARAVDYGERVEAEDLAVVRLSPDAALAPVPAAQRASVIGRYAAVPLVAGSLVTRGQLADEAVPGPGRQVVSVSLKAEQAPAHPLRAGVPVLLVRTPDGGALGSVRADEPLAAPPGVAGTVRAVRELEYGAGVVVDVVVAASDGPTLAAAAAGGHVAVVVTAGS